MTPPSGLIEFLKGSDDFLISTHVSPDGDGIGSSIALSMMLKAIGKKTTLFCKDPIPYQYLFLPGAGDFFSFSTYISSGYKAKNLILVDCNAIKRIGLDTIELPQFIFSKIAVIDHHEINTSFGDIQWIDPQVPATGLMIYHLIKHLGIKITPEMATNLYTTISFDTGNFRYENATPDVFRAAADLTDAGAKPHMIYSSLFEKWSFNRFKLLLAVMGSLELADGIAFGTITREMFAQTMTTDDDSESFVSFIRILDEVIVSAIIIEVDDNFYRVSLRSKKGINVAEIATSFGGGGHRNAAGFRTKTDLVTLKKNLRDKIKAALYQFL